jgi:TPR repeat protein
VKILGVIGALTILIVGASQFAFAQDREPSTSEKRLALVIGNGAYLKSPLRNPVNDARAMGGTLQSLGFEVVLRENVSYKDMRRTIIEFGARLREGGVGVFYYAGHGVQVSGRNYMMPVDAVIEGEAEVSVEAVDVDYVLSRMETARNRLNIVILDACRDDPFSRSFRSPVKGLASIDAPIGTLIAYATAPGRVANDGEGPNGLYTSELLKEMKTPGLKIEDMFKRVRHSVSQRTKGQQVPWEASSLVGDFSFAASPGAVSSAGQAERPLTPTQELPQEQKPASGTQISASEGDDLDRAKQYMRSSDWRSALPLLREAARKGSGEAMGYLGDFYGNGRGVARDQAEAVRWYQKGADAGNSFAMRALGFMYQNGWGVTKDETQAVHWYRKSADAGNAVAMNDLGLAYANGWGVGKDGVEATRWVRKSAGAGDALAMRNLGLMYHNGTNVTKDDAEAARWLRKSADAGDSVGARTLAYHYMNGWGVEQNDTEALRWLRKSADGGDLEAMNDLGVFYANGRGVAKDEVEAVRWYRKSAEAGNPLAMRNLGFMYASGWGVTRDEAAATAWLRKGAEAGDVLAMRVLGTMYQNGVGVTADPVEATKWFKKAASLGDKASIERLNALSKDR